MEGPGRLSYKQFSGRRFGINLALRDIAGEIRTRTFYEDFARSLDEWVYDFLVSSGLQLEMDPKSLGKSENQIL
jgi:hypothetical protein